MPRARPRTRTPRAEPRPRGCDYTQKNARACLLGRCGRSLVVSGLAFDFVSSRYPRRYLNLSRRMRWCPAPRVDAGRKPVSPRTCRPQCSTARLSWPAPSTCTATSYCPTRGRPRRCASSSAARWVPSKGGAHEVFVRPSMLSATQPSALGHTGDTTNCRRHRFGGRECEGQTLHLNPRRPGFY